MEPKHEYESGEIWASTGMEPVVAYVEALTLMMVVTLPPLGRNTLYGFSPMYTCCGARKFCKYREAVSPLRLESVIVTFADVFRARVKEGG